MSTPLVAPRDVAVLGDVAAEAIARRPRLFPVAWAGGTAHPHVRTTCCLYGRPDAAAGGREDGTCSTRPLRGDESSTRRIRTSLVGGS